jgi:parallel beta-helix repeat protein
MARLLLLSIVGFATLAPAGQGETAACDKVASPQGANSARGTIADPYRTAQVLVDSLRPGETGCLRAGTYYESVRVDDGGKEARRVTIRSYPGEQATIMGRLWVTDTGNRVTFAFLKLNGKNERNLPSPYVNGDGVIFLNNEITNDHTGICLQLGSHAYGVAVRTVVQENEIHDCGRLPATNYDHGIYLAASRGTRVAYNRIFRNADRGIQLYPDAQRTRIIGNWIDSNGEGILFAGDGGVASNNNLVRGNVISNSLIRYNVESWYPRGNPIGRRNLVDSNVIYGGTLDDGDGGIQRPAVGFSTRNNVLSP